MKIVLFYHSLLSDWNHGNAHFLRGITTELLSRGHDVIVYEPEGSWSRRHLIEEYGEKPIRKFRAAYPALRSTFYDASRLDLDAALRGADLVIVHEWNDPTWVRRLGEHRAGHGGYRLFFHDTHHRMHSDPGTMAAYDLCHYDGVLAYGNALRDLYVQAARVKRCWTWHEAADTRRFRPIPNCAESGDLVWIGNWGDGERAEELQEFLIQPAKALKLRARVYGVRYPEHARRLLNEAGIEYGGWLPNYEVPEIFARYRLTLHVPRRPYVRALPGIPTIRVFEAMACGIPLVCSPWEDVEQLFHPGRDFLMARNGREMTQQIDWLLRDEKARRSLSDHAVNTIRERHTCVHRVDALVRIIDELRGTDGQQADHPRSADHENVKET